MRRISLTFTFALMSLMSLLAVPGYAGDDADMAYARRHAFSNVGLSAGVSIYGAGVSVSTPLARSVNLRLDYHLLCMSSPLKQSSSPNVAVISDSRSFEIYPEDGKETLNSHVLRLLVDWTPFRHGAGSVFLTGGLLFQNKIAYRYSEMYDKAVFADFGLTGKDLSQVEIIRPGGRYGLNEDCAVGCYASRPEVGVYVGLTFGRPVPKRRVGVRGEIGMPVYFGYWSVHGDAPVLNFRPFSTGLMSNSPVTASLYLAVHVTVRLLKDK